MFSPLPNLPTLDTLQNALGTITQEDKNALGVGTQQTEGQTDLLTKAVIIIIGLILIAVGLFSFDRTKNFVLQTAKAGAKAAAVA